MRKRSRQQRLKKRGGQKRVGALDLKFGGRARSKSEYILIRRVKMRRIEKALLDLLHREWLEERRYRLLESAGVSIVNLHLEPIHVVLDILGLPDTGDNFDRQDFLGKFDELVPTNGSNECKRYLRWAKKEVARLYELFGPTF